MKRLMVALSVGAVLGAAHPAAAWSWHECNGTPAKWENNAAHYRVMRCSIPEGSQRAADVLYGFDEWNAVHGMWDVFTHEWGPTECVGISHSNDRNEVYFGVPSQMDGAVGVTALRYDSCFWWFDTQHIVETDVAFDAAQMTEWGNPPCNTNNPFGSRTTVVHEFGHALGLEHFDDAMNLMMTSDGEGKYCGNFVVEPHPDDADGGRFLYGSGNRSTDIGASEQRLAGPNNVSSTQHRASSTSAPATAIRSAGRSATWEPRTQPTTCAGISPRTTPSRRPTSWSPAT